MEIREKTVDRNLLLELSGELDHHAARKAMEEMEMAIDAAVPLKLVLDLGGVTFMDSSGIALLLRARRRMEALGGNLMVRHVPDQARRVLDAGDQPIDHHPLRRGRRISAGLPEAGPHDRRKRYENEQLHKHGIFEPQQQ